MTVCQVLSPMTPELNERGMRGGPTEKRTSLRSLPFETGALSPLLKGVLPKGLILCLNLPCFLLQKQVT